MTRLLPAPPGLLPKPKRSRQQAASAKGHRIEQLAKRMYEAMGCLVETAPKVVRWVPNGAWAADGTSQMVPRSMRHDFWGVADLLVLDGRDPERRCIFLVQVMTPNNLSARRRKLVTSGVPFTIGDRLLAYAGRGVFRAYEGPEFFTEVQPMRVPPLRKTTP